jgi:hypothetical protein
MKEFGNRQFLSLFDDDSAAMFADRTFERCLFTNCVLANTERIDRRSTVKNVTLTDCRQVGCAVGPAILEDVLVDGLDTSDLFIVWGALFRRVTLRNRVGSIKINPYPQIDESNAKLARPFDHAREDFYAGRRGVLRQGRRARRSRYRGSVSLVRAGLAQRWQARRSEGNLAPEADRRPQAGTAGENRAGASEARGRVTGECPRGAPNRRWFGGRSK